jgi:hypothetical protein
MNIDSLIRTSIEIIKTDWELPKSGFIAGGSIANIVWELVSGNKAIINDIDVFHFDGEIESIDTSDNSLLFRYQEKDTKFYEDYIGISHTQVNKDFYVIVSSETDGIFNHIKYKSNKSDTDLILRSFDINATGVGYSIEEDKCYWTEDFEKFLQSGELKVCNLMTPSHTSIRIVKKADELNCKLDHFEIDLLKHSLEWRFGDIIKIRFRERYFNLFEKYKDLLSKDFETKRDEVAEEYVKVQFGEEVQLHYLVPIIINKIVESNINDFVYSRQVFSDENINKIYNSMDFLFYMRNIYENSDLKLLWENLYYFYKEKEYVDCFPEKSDLDFLSRVAKYAPDSIENLKGLKLSEQIKLVKDIFERYESDPIVAISILERHKLNEIELTDENLFLLELSVRKKIVNDTKGKVNKVLNIKEEQKNPLNDPDFWL